MVLVTGSQGFIGSHLYNQLESKIGLDKSYNKIDQNYILVDLCHHASLFWLLRDLEIDTVFHNAAVPSVPLSYEKPMVSYMNNVSASINLIDICKKIGIKKFIFASSSSVLGSSPYGHSKKIIEEVLEKSGLNYTILRYFNVIGPRQRQNVAEIMYKKIKNNETVQIYGDGTTTRDFTYVDNVVLANKLAVDSKYDGKILEVGTGKPHSLIDLYEEICARVNPNHEKLEFLPDRIGDIKYSCADTFLPKDKIVSFTEGLDKWLLPLESQASAQLAAL
jgi:UDP-glucose 4-epimerase